MVVEAVIGSQWGDEGKGKLVDLLAVNANVVCRFNGGSNAGHTIIHEGEKYALHILPSGVIHNTTLNLIGNGVVIHVPTLLKELEQLETRNKTPKLFIAERAHLVFDFHQTVDGLRETNLGKNQIGTTKRGIGPTYSSKMTRSGVRMGDLRNAESFEKKVRNLYATLKEHYNLEHDIDEEVSRFINVYREKLIPMLVDGVKFIHEKLENPTNHILLEGANAVMLDIDFGTYPFVTSSSPCIGGACTGLGLPPRAIGNVHAVVKAYTTRVGAGPFPTELTGDIGEKIRKIGHEFGTTTGRPRRCGWLDIVPLLHATRINGFADICMTKLDCLAGFDELKVCTGYKVGEEIMTYFPSNLDILEKVEPVYETVPGFKEDISKARSWDELPENAKKYIKYVESLLKVPIKWVGVGPSREEMITIHH
mmetsp:Transcript_2650/g.3811  ORF Transcript_2650/g.3811 Transcript_2650/m.3811 type:complete len:422 (-) Transcript_2650:53-1318(-)